MYQWAVSQTGVSSDREKSKQWCWIMISQTNFGGPLLAESSRSLPPKVGVASVRYAPNTSHSDVNI
jgi:hypothetical protein